MIITQIIRRFEQGETRPFICRVDDSHVYYLVLRYPGKPMYSAMRSNTPSDRRNNNLHTTCNKPCPNGK